jgi:hypothetical protein
MVTEVLADVSEGVFDDVVVANLELDVQIFAEGLLDQAAVACVLPFGEANGADDVVGLVDHVLDDDRGVVASEGLEQVG